ncbi:MAG: fatty acid desaturase, partial [Pseudomonadota bacterium]
NNLHAVHHAYPRAPWYALPGLYSALGHGLLRGNGGLYYGGYGSLLRRFAVRPVDSAQHPIARSINSSK